MNNSTLYRLLNTKSTKAKVNLKSILRKRLYRFPIIKLKEKSCNQSISLISIRKNNTLKNTNINKQNTIDEKNSKKKVILKKFNIRFTPIQVAKNKMRAESIEKLRQLERNLAISRVMVRLHIK